MTKKILIIIICIFSILMTACSNRIKQNDNTGKIYLNDKYYNNGNFIKVKGNDLSNINNENYILFTYNNYCNMAIPCENIFQEFMTKYKIDFLSISFEEFKKTKFYQTVKYAPSVLVVEHGNIVAYLNANSDDDLEKYQDTNKFEEWLNNYIYFSK